MAEVGPPEKRRRSEYCWVGKARLVCAAVITGLLAACGSGVGPVPAQSEADSLPLANVGRQLVEQVINQSEWSLQHTLKTSSSKELTIDFQLPGLDAMAGSYAHLATACDASSVFDPTCQSAFGTPAIAPGLDTCFRFGCLAAGAPFADVYVTSQGKPSPDSRGPISYVADSLSEVGTITYDPNPMTRWQYTMGPGAKLAVAANVDEVATFTGAVSDMDFSYTGSLSGMTDLSSVWHLELSFAHIASDAEVDVVLDNGDDAPRYGTIATGSLTLATISDSGIEWLPVCRSAHAACDGE